VPRRQIEPKQPCAVRLLAGNAEPELAMSRPPNFFLEVWEEIKKLRAKGIDADTAYKLAITKVEEKDLQLKLTSA
jgi:hypothetical protein